MIVFLAYWLTSSLMVFVGLLILAAAHGWEDTTTPDEDAEQMAWLAARAK